LRKREGDFSKDLEFVKKEVDKAINKEFQKFEKKQPKKKKQKEKFPYDFLLEKYDSYHIKTKYKQKKPEKIKKIKYNRYIKNNLHTRIINSLQKKKNKKQKKDIKEISKITKKKPGKIQDNEEEILKLSKKNIKKRKKIHLKITHHITMLFLMIIMIFAMSYLIYLNWDSIVSTNSNLNSITDEEAYMFCTNICYNASISNSQNLGYFMCGCNDKVQRFDSISKKELTLEDINKRISFKNMFNTVISDYDAKCKFECGRQNSEIKFQNYSISNISKTIFCQCLFEEHTAFPMIDR